jgi:hypothetical protein
VPEEVPKLVADKSRRKGAILLPPADFRAIAPWLIFGGLALAIVGWVDTGLFWIPLRFGNQDWEIGTISQTVDSLPLLTLSLLLMAIGVRAQGARRIWSRLFAVFFIAMALFLVVCVVIFLLDFPLIMSAASQLQGSGLRRGAFKVVLFGTTYILTYTTIGVLMWRATSRKKAAEVAAKPARS